METHTTSAPIARTFDPSVWLENFENAGGAYVLTADHLHLMVRVLDNPDDQQREAKELIAALSDDDFDSLQRWMRRGWPGFTPELWTESFIAAGGYLTASQGRPMLGYPEEQHVELSNLRARLSSEQVAELRTYLRRLLDLEEAA